MKHQKVKRSELTYINSQQDCLQIVNKNSQSQPKESIFFKQYQQIMNKFQPLHNRQELMSKLANRNIQFQESFQNYDLHLKILKQMPNSQAVLVEAKYCNYKTSISLLAVNTNFIEPSEVYAAGGFGVIFIYSHQGQNIAIKNIKFYHRKQILKMIIRQYFFNLLMSALECGPIVSKALGFDIIVFQDSAIFAMEKCQQIYPLSGLDFTPIYRQLKTLHGLGIVHGDIKPDNILYSPKLQKMVLCDFGLTKMIKQNLGQKTLTRFFGSFAYASCQMCELFSRQDDKIKEGQIDLYFNDIFCLRNTINSHYYKVESQNAYDLLIFPRQFRIFKCKYLLFMNQYQQIDQHYQQQQVLDFMLKIQPTHHFYKFFISRFGFAEYPSTKYEQEIELHKIYSSNGVNENYWKTQKTLSKQKQLPFTYFIDIEQYNQREQAQIFQSVKIKELEATLQEQTNNKEILFRNLVIYLSLWRQQTWNQAQIVIKSIYSRIKKQIEFEIPSSQIPNECNNLLQSNNYCVTSQYALIKLLQRLREYYAIQKNSKHLDIIGQFQFAFLCLNSYSQCKFLAFKFKLEQTKLQTTKAVLCFSYIIQLLTQLKIQTFTEQLIQQISRAGNITQIQFLRAQIEQYACYLRKYLKIDRDSSKQNVELKFKINHKYAQYCQIVRACIIARINLFDQKYQNMLQILEYLEKKIDILPTSISSNLKKFVTFLYIVYYCLFKNKQALHLLTQQVIVPASYQNLWKKNNVFLLAKKYQIQRSRKKFYQLLDQSLLNPDLNIINKLILLASFLNNLPTIYKTLKETFIKFHNLCMNEIKLMAEKQVQFGSKIHEFFFIIISLISLESGFSLEDSWNKKNAKILFQTFDKYKQFATITEISKQVYSRMIFYCSKSKYIGAIEYFEQSTKQRQLTPSFYCLCQMALVISYSKLNSLKVSTTLRVYRNLLQTQNQYFIVRCAPFMLILQNLFFQYFMIEQYLSLFYLMLKHIYIDKLDSKDALEFFSRRIYRRNQKFIVRIASNFIQDQYYLFTKIFLHNFSYFLLIALVKKSVKFINLFDILKKIAHTIDSLNQQLKICSIRNFYIVISRFFKGRKKSFILRAIQGKNLKRTIKNYIRRKIIRNTLKI